jgi:sortase A
MTRAIGTVFVVFGIIAALITGVALMFPESAQSLYSFALPHIAPVERQVPATAPQKIAEGNPIGVIEIPRLGLSSVVLEGDEEAALLFGVGHLADTPLPWLTVSGGNSVFAAHRDTFFRGLEAIRPKDVIRFRAGSTELEYRVKETKIVEPTDVAVLAPTRTSTLTLITCYPFRYVGPAPQRFIVRAERTSRT